MASSSSVSVPPLMKYREPRNWAELPQELMSSILFRLGMVEILRTAQKVCRSWRRVCKDPSMWRKIDLSSVGSVYFEWMSLQVVDLSQGGLLEINISNYNSDILLDSIVERSSNLRSLELEINDAVTNKGLVNAIAKLPLLETLDISHSMLKLDLEAIGQACPQLQTFKLNCSCYIPSRIERYDGYALAIAESMTN